MSVFDEVIYRQGKDGRIFIFEHGKMHAPVIIMIAAAAISAQGQMEAGKAADAQAKSEQNMANYNAALGEREAKQTEAVTALQQKQQAEASDRAASTSKAGLGASGAVTTTGSPLLIQAEQASQNELQNLMIGYQGAEEATALRSGAALDVMGGKIARQRGSAAKTASYYGAGSTLLSSFSSMAGGFKGGGGSSAATGSGMYGGTGGGGPTGGGSRSMIG
jgi:hypothetical protein